MAEPFLTLEEFRKLVKQVGEAIPLCPNCLHPIHKAYTCGMTLDATGKATGQRKCDCNWSFQLTPVKSTE